MLFLFLPSISEKSLKREKHLPAQACFELGQIYRRMEDFDEAHLWFKKAKKYSNYITDVMVEYRVNYVLSSIKNRNLVSE